MLTSPQSVTINTVATDLNRTQPGATSSVYESSDGTLTFKVSHQISGKRMRRMARLDQTVVAANPLTAVNAYQKAGVYIVIDEPEFGFSSTEVGYLVEGLKTWLSSANVLAMLANRH